MGKSIPANAPRPPKLCAKCGQDHGGKCVAHSGLTGRACRKWPIHGATVCPTHGGSTPQVKAAAAQRIRDFLAEAIDPDRVLREAGRIAYSDIRDIFDDHGNLRPVKEWPEDIARAVAAVEVVKRNVDSGDGKMDDVLKVRLWDKVSKLTNLMKYHGQLTEKLDVTLSGSIVERLQAGRKRVASGKR